MTSLFKLWIVFGMTILLSLTACRGDSTAGREFMIMFLQMNVIEKDPSFIVATTKESTVITVTIQKLNYTQTYNVVSRTKLEISVPKSVVPTSDGLDKLGILIESTEMISLWGVHDASRRSVDGFHVLPTDVLGREYFGVSSEPHSGAELGVVATEDETTVTVRYDQSYTFDGWKLLPRYPLKIKLDRFETLFINMYTDITGIHVEASAPVAAFSGNQCAFIPLSWRYCDYIVTQLVPFERWGMDYVLTPFLGHIDYAVKVIAGRRRTTVTIGNGKHQYTIGKSEYLTLNLDSSEVITASRSVMVVQFTLGQTLADGMSHSAMTVIPAIRQYTNDAVIATTSADDQQQKLHFLNLIATCYDFEKQYILLDGTPVDVVNGTEIYMNDTAYCINQMPLNTNYSSITTLVPNALFYALINERTEFYSTAWPANFHLPQTTCYTSNEEGITVEHICDNSVVIFTYPCPEPCPAHKDEELTCDPCVDALAVFIVMFLSSGLTICAEHFIRCCRAARQHEWEVEMWKRKAAMNQRTLDTSAWDRQIEITRKYHRKKLEQEFAQS